jgi:hypothetical protein
MFQGIRIGLSLPSRGKGATEAIASAVETLAKIDLAYLERYPRCVPLAKSGVRYRREPKGPENWQNIPETLSRGYGDCEDLAAWRIAELRFRKIPANPHVTFDRGMYHITVRAKISGKELFFDPSKELGM